MIRVLHVFHDMSNGGVERFVMNYYRHVDRQTLQFDFLTAVDEPGHFDEEILAYGGRLFRAFPLEKNPIRHYLDLARIVRQNHFQTVCRHTGGALGYFDLRAARHGGARNLILHAHSANAGASLVHAVANRLLKFECRRFACSQRAGAFLFGSNTNVEIIRNAIDVESYRFRSEERDSTRRELGIEGKFVVGHVGAFQKVKNQRRAVSIFREIYKKRSDSLLVFVGDGPTMNETKDFVKSQGLEKRVLFLGSRNDVGKIMQTFDVFLFPSLAEGFGMALIEAQTNGLRCFASQDVVPQEVDMTGDVCFIPLSSSDSQWAESILQSDLSRDAAAAEKVRHAGYDISAEAEKLQTLYLSLEKSARQ